MSYKYHFYILMICVLQQSSPVSSNTLRVGSGLSLSLHNCTKDKLLQFPNPSAITDLNVLQCHIPTLENTFFTHFTALNNLEIIDSQLTFLDDYSFNGLKYLRSLSLAHNKLSFVQSWSNEQMSALISLDLKRNAIRKLTLKSFVRYPNLQRLNLMGNLLEDIDDDIFRWMPQLKYLNLGRNRLVALENRDFHGMHRLSYLGLHFNDIENVEIDSFGTNNHLRTLRLEGNKLSNLEFLKAKSLIRLQHLNLSFNELETMNGMMFSKDYELAVLDLSHNRLKEVKGDMMGLESLVNLNFSHNFLQYIQPNAFNALFSIEYLDISHNALQHLPACIFNFTNQLQYIDLSNNKLSTINATLFTPLSYLKSLDLSQNQLSNDDFIVYIASEVQVNELSLNLSDNHFRSINVSSLLGFDKVELAGNWWSCKWLIKRMLTLPKSIKFGRTYMVHTEWSTSMLDTNGIDCYEEDSKKNIIILDTSTIWEQKLQNAMCSQPSSKDVHPSPPPLNWPRIKMDRFDSRSVVLWMLIAITLAFSALRIGRKLVDQKESSRKYKELKEMQKLRSKTDKLPIRATDIAQRSEDKLIYTPTHTK